MNERAEVGVSPEELRRSMSGLEFLQAMIDGKLPGPPIMRTMDFRLTEVSDGRALFVGNPQLDFYNPIGTVHGGWAATLLDSAVGCAIHTTLQVGEAYTTLELKLNMVRPIFDTTGPVKAEGRLIHRGRTVATADGTLTDGAGKLLAHASTTCMIFPAKG